MDRRTFAAFGLIFLILVGSQFVMDKLYGGSKTAAADSTMVIDERAIDQATLPADLPPSNVSAHPDNPYTEGDPAEELAAAEKLNTGQDALRPVSQGEPRVITVTTPLYRMQLSTAGGRVVSWEGFEHDSHLGGPVKLVPEDIAEFGLDALVFEGAELDLGSVVYEADLYSLELVEGGSARTLEMTVGLAGGMEVRKTLVFDPELYGISITHTLLAVDGGPTRRSLELLGRPRRFRFGWNQGIVATERVQRMEEPSMRSFARVGEDYHYKKRQGLKKNVEKVEGRWRGSVHFAGLQSRYFTVVGIVPQEQGEPVEGTIGLSGDQDRMNQTWTIDVPARATGEGDIAAASLDLFIGPQEAALLASYDQGLEKSMDLGWKLFRPLAEIVLWGLEYMHRYISNYGVIIIIFSVLTKLLFYPLTRKSTESMKKMQDLQPKLKALQEKYKKDKDKLNSATMNLYKEEKVNPLSGCLPLVVQSPVFIALYQALSHTIALRGQPFVLWMNDLSQPDALTQLPFALPFLGSDLNVLPILMSVAMYFQTKMTPTSGAGGQMAAMNTMMPLIMVFIFYNMPSGLVLYWLVNTVMQGYQTWRIHQAAPSKGAQAT
ncbi:MAG: membrane protein insertase YidC [bacterium]|nr:membrane protein insertase YidC [bacterium]